MPTSSIVRGVKNWTINIVNTSGTNVSIEHIDVSWYNWSKLEKASLREKIIWGSILGAGSPQTLTFYYIAPEDLIVYSGAAENNNLQFAFMDDYFVIYQLKVFLTNGCYVQYLR